MAKKLTDEQKAANKAAQKLRGAAWRARRKLYEQAEDKLNSTLHAAAEQGAVDVAVARLEERRVAYVAADDELRRQIAAIERQRVALQEAFSADADKLKTARDVTQRELRQVRERLQAELNDQFPDMKGCWYASAWQPPEGYIEQFAKNYKEGKE